MTWVGWLPAAHIGRDLATDDPPGGPHDVDQIDIHPATNSADRRRILGRRIATGPGRVTWE